MTLWAKALDVAAHKAREIKKDFMQGNDRRARQTSMLVVIVRSVSATCGRTGIGDCRILL
jgi:hypothetical protein